MTDRLAQLEAALVKADAAGATDDARALAGEIRRMREFSQVKAEGQAVKQPTPFRTSIEKVPSDADAMAGNPMIRGLYGAAEPFLGVGQKLLNLVGMGGRVNQALADTNAQIERGRENIGSTGFDAFRFGGNVGSPAFIGAAGSLPAASTALQRVRQGAGFGAAAGAAQPVYDPNNVWGQTGINTGVGMALGAAVPGVMELGKGVGRAVRNVVEPYISEAGADRAVGRLARNVAGDKADEIIAALQNPRELTPGSIPHAGQAAVPANSAEFSAFQKFASNDRPSLYYGPQGLEGQQSAARLAAVRSVGGNASDIAKLEAARAYEGSINYGAAFKENVKADGTLRALFGRPSMDKAFARAEEIAKEKGVPFAISKDAPAQEVKSAILGSNGQPASVSVIPSKSAEFPVSSLHSVKMALDDMIKNPERFGIGASEVRAIGDTRQAFMKWLEMKSPQYKVAREAYAAQSLPINQRQVGQELEKRLTSSISEEAPQRATVFANAMREAPQTIKKATGQPRFDELSQVLNPRQMETMKGVLDDLSRNADYERLAQKGSIAARKIIGLPEAPPSGMFSPAISVTRGFYNRAVGAADEKILQNAAILMKDPEKLARLMQDAKPAERKAIVDYLSRLQATSVVPAVDRVK